MWVKWISMILLATLAQSVLAQKKPMRNEDIIQLTKAEFDEDTIIKAIEADDAAFDVTVDGLIALKNAGVRPKVISAMLVRHRSVLTRPPDPPVHSAPTPKPGPSTPPSRPWPTEVAGMEQEIGIYYRRDGEFTPLYGKPIVGSKTGGFLKSALTYGISKVRMKGQLPGKHAQLQVSDRHPAFYFYMPEAQSPDSFNIIRMEEEGDRREFEVGSAGGITGGASSGLDLKKVHQTVIERLAPRLFRVTPDVELKEGEYGFIGSFTYTTAGLAGAGEKVYDFGVPKQNKQSKR